MKSKGRKLQQNRAQHLHQELRPKIYGKARDSYTLNELPQPQVLFTFGLLNLNPAPSSVST